MIFHSAQSRPDEGPSQACCSPAPDRSMGTALSREWRRYRSKNDRRIVLVGLVRVSFSFCPRRMFFWLHFLTHCPEPLLPSQTRTPPARPRSLTSCGSTKQLRPFRLRNLSPPQFSTVSIPSSCGTWAGNSSSGPTGATIYPARTASSSWPIARTTRAYNR